MIGNTQKEMQHLTTPKVNADRFSLTTILNMWSILSSE